MTEDTSKVELDGIGNFWYNQGVTDTLYMLSKCRYAYENDLKIYGVGTGVRENAIQSIKAIDYCISKIRDLLNKKVEKND